MIDGKRILAVMPAGGGSKGVPMKNIRPVNGAPLIAFYRAHNKQRSFVIVVSTAQKHP